MKEHNTTKLYYTRAEVARELGEPVSTVKYWTEQFNVPLKPSAHGRARYNAQALDQLQRIRYLRRTMGLSLPQIQHALQNPSTAVRNADIAAILTSLRTQLVQLRHALDQYTVAQAALPYKKNLPE